MSEQTRVCLVTGASSGIGQATAKSLVAAGHHVLVTGRDEDRLATAVPGAEAVRADFAGLDGVRGLAEEVRERHDRLDVLVNNAGLTSARRATGPDCTELTWTVNYLAPFLLTHLLLPLGPTHVVNVSSAAQALGRLDLDDPGFERRRWGSLAAYAQAKLALVMFTVELAARHPDLVVNSVHPGGSPTRLSREAGPVSRAMIRLWVPFAATPEQAARSVVALTDATTSGGYYVKRDPPRLRRPNRLAEDPAARRALWDASTRMTGIG